MLPRIAPSASPANTSRRITRHQSRSFTSPSASARITSVDACDPELPPLEMISGTNSARTTAFAISFSKKPIAVAVSISPRNSTTSQPARFLTMRGERDLQVRLVERFGCRRTAGMSRVAAVLGDVERHRRR